MIDKHKLEQKYNNFGYLSTKFWLKGNDPRWSTYTTDHRAHCTRDIVDRGQRLDVLFNYLI